MVPPLTLCANMKKGPNLRWSLIRCSGGDEGDRTPDLLTASQALSQLSYAPVTRKYYTGTRTAMQGQFWKNFPEARAPLGRERGADSRARDPRCRIRPAGRAPRAAALPPPSSPAPPGHLGFRRSPVFASTPRAAIRPTTIPPAPGPLSGPIALPPTRRFQNHGGLRGQAGNPLACRNR